MRPRATSAIPPRAVTRAVLALRRRLLALADAVVPPPLALFEHAMGVARTQLLHAAARLRLADELAAGPRTAAELARAAGVREDELFRTLRALASAGVFALRPDGRFENNRLSEALRSDAPATMAHFLEYAGSASNVAAWSDVDRTLSQGGHAFERVHGQNVWDWFAAHPEEERTFGAAMVSFTELDAPLVAAGYPFGAARRVCDVAGGHGTLLAEILARHARLRGVLLDAASVLDGARALLARRGVADRVECVAGSFLEAVPPGCDVYLLKDVLHDWDDATAARILGACRRAAAPGARVLVAEILLERSATASPGPLVDVQMMMVTSGGRQRSAAEHGALLERAGFRPGRVIELAGALSLVEGVAA